MLARDLAGSGDWLRVKSSDCGAGVCVLIPFNWDILDAGGHFHHRARRSLARYRDSLGDQGAPSEEEEPWSKSYTQTNPDAPENGADEAEDFGGPQPTGSPGGAFDEIDPETVPPRKAMPISRRINLLPAI